MPTYRRLSAEMVRHGSRQQPWSANKTLRDHTYAALASPNARSISRVSASGLSDAYTCVCLMSA